MSPRFLALFALYGAAASAGTPHQATVRYTDLPPDATPQQLAADGAGNVFLIAGIVEPSGRPQIRVLKVDPQGHTLASMDFGGSTAGLGVGDQVVDAAVDPNGNLVLLGRTTSPDFPLVMPLVSDTGPTSTFVVKLDPLLKMILFSTRLGGTQGGTSPGALVLDQQGNLYVTGSTSDTDFPVTRGAFQTQPPPFNPSDPASYAFVAEIGASTNSMVFSTYFGDSETSCTADSFFCGSPAETRANAIALDSAGNVVIAGATTANHLPITPGVFGPDCGDCNLQAEAGFVAKFSPDGSKLLWATYVPVVRATTVGFSEAGIATMTLDRDGNVIAGGTASVRFPVTAGALQTAFPGYQFSGFVMKLDSSGQHLLFATYLGDEVTGVLADSQGDIWAMGDATADTLPVPEGTPTLGVDYIAQLTADGSALETIFTAPSGATGLAMAAADGGLISMGESGALFMISPGSGPSLVGIGNSAGSVLSRGVAPYELISFYGLDLATQSASDAQVAGGRLTTSLGGVQVLFDGIPSPLLYAGPNQINAVVPSTVFGRDKTILQISTPAGVLQIPGIPVQPSLPDVFPASGAQSVLYAPIADARNQDGSINSSRNPATPGSIVTVWASGTGLSTALPTDGVILDCSDGDCSDGDCSDGAPSLPVSISGFTLLSISRGGLQSGTLSLEVLSARDAPGMVAGITEIRFRLPQQFNFDPGNYGFSLQVGDAFSDAFGLYLKSH